MTINSVLSVHAYIKTLFQNMYDVFHKDRFFWLRNNAQKKGLGLNWGKHDTYGNQDFPDPEII